MERSGLAAGAAITTLALSVGAIVLAWREIDRLRGALMDLTKELESERLKRQSERTGRINLQQNGRRQMQQRQQEEGFTLLQIGKVESPFHDRRGTPRQPSLVPAARARIRFDKRMIQFDHFAELREFSHIWVLFIFHENTNLGQVHHPPAKIRPPRLHGKRVGTLSTRSPHRPNPIGLSWCEIESVGPDYIEVRGIDLCDGTPVLDIKPYIPYDVVPCSIALPMAVDASGNPLQSNLRQLFVPAWIYEADITMRDVRFTPFAEKSLNSLFLDRRTGAFAHSGSAEKARELVEQVLRQDVRGIHQGRGAGYDAGAGDGYGDGDTSGKTSTSYMCRLDGLEISFTTTEKTIEVCSITAFTAFGTTTSPEVSNKT